MLPVGAPLPLLHSMLAPTQPDGLAAQYDLAILPTALCWAVRLVTTRATLYSIIDLAGQTIAQCQSVPPPLLPQQPVQ